MVLQPVGDEVLKALFGRFQMFGLGLSWGGFESLALPSDAHMVRAATPWPHEGRVIRVHAGLENVDDLIADMRQAFEHAARV